MHMSNGAKESSGMRVPPACSVRGSMTNARSMFCLATEQHRPTSLAAKHHSNNAAATRPNAGAHAVGTYDQGKDMQLLLLLLSDADELAEARARSGSARSWSSDQLLAALAMH
jgi:hypothetical protein